MDLLHRGLPQLLQQLVSVAEVGAQRVGAGTLAETLEAGARNEAPAGATRIAGAAFEDRRAGVEVNIE